MIESKEEILLEELVPNIVRDCINPQGYIEAGHLKHIMDIKLPCYFDNVDFSPCEIDESILTVTYRYRFGGYYFHRCFNLESIIKDYLEGYNVK